MPSLRTLGFSTALTQANAISWAWFVRVDIASPVGTVRFTDYRPGTVSLDVGDGAGSQTWTAADFVLSGLTQNGTDILVVASIDFENLDYTWTNWANTPGLRGAPVCIWRVWFNVDGTFAGAYTPFRGIIDNQEHATRSRMALKPFGVQWERQTPWQTLEQIDPVFNTLMPSRELTIYRPGGVVTPTYAS